MLGLLIAAAVPAQPSTAAAQPSATSLEELRRQAEDGDRDAQHELGIELMLADDEASLVEARRWLRAAMEAGSAEAKNAYAALLLNGGGGPRDEETGRRLMLEAAAEGSVGANMTLSAAYRNGDGGFERDLPRAFAHMRAAADRAIGESAAVTWWELGMMYLDGIGTVADPEEAYRWVSRAAEAGNVNGMISRGVMLATGEGVAEDDAAARHWYQRAAESGRHGFGHALRSLGAMLATGEGGPVDLPRGIAYLRIGAAAGDEHAPRILEAWRGRITDEVDRQARQIADRWQADHLPEER